jgi:cyd operon protein YbgT
VSVPPSWPIGHSPHRLLRSAPFFFMIAAKGCGEGAAGCGFTLGSIARYLCVPACLLLYTGSAPRFAVRHTGQTIKETAMWYFSWILGIGVALGFGIINVMWLETNGKFARDPLPADAQGSPPDTREGDSPS